MVLFRFRLSRWVQWAFLWLSVVFTVSAADRQVEIVTQDTHAGLAYGVAFSPDERFFATAGLDNAVKLWDLAHGELLHTFHGPTNLVRNVAFSADGNLLAGGSADGSLWVWHVHERRFAYKKRETSTFIVALDFSPDGKYLATGGYDNVILLRNASDGEIIHRLEGHGGAVEDMAFSADSQRLASGGWDRQMILWDPHSGKEVLRREHGESVRSLAWSADGKALYTGDSAGTWKRWDREGKLLNDHTLGAAIPSQMAIPRSEHVAVAELAMVRIRDPKSGAEVGVIPPLGGNLFDVAVSSSGRWLLVTGDAASVGLVDLETRRYTHTIRSQTDPLTDCRAVEFLDEHRLVAQVSDSKLAVIDWKTGMVTKTMDCGHRIVWALALAPNGNALAVGGMNPSTALIHDLQSGNSQSLNVGHHRVRSLAISHDGKWLVSSGHPKHEDSERPVAMQLWEFPSGKLLKNLPETKDTVVSSAFSPDNRWLFTVGLRDGGRLWDTTSWEVKHHWPLEKGKPYRGGFSPDGKYVALSSTQGFVMVVDAMGGEILHRLETGSGGYSFAFSPDGEQLAVGGDNGTTHLFDLETGQVEQVLEVEGHVLALSYHPTLNQLVSGSRGNHLSVWNPKSGELLGRRVSFGRTDWAIYNPKTLRVLATEEAWPQLSLRFNDDFKQTYPIHYYEPRLRCASVSEVLEDATVADVAPKPWRRRWDAVEHPMWWLSPLFLLPLALWGGFSLRNVRLQRQRARQVQFYRRLMESQETARARMAKEIHDSLGQNLLIIKSQADMRLDETPRGSVADDLEMIRDLAMQSIHEVRHIAYDLHPAQLERLGLTKAIGSMAQRVFKSTNVKLNLQLNPIDDAVSKTDEIQIFRLVQESLNNALKHAEASEITVSTDRSDAGVHVRVSDDGVGFEKADSRAAKVHLGLTGMQERAAMMGATLSIRSTPGQGTRIDLRVS